MSGEKHNANLQRKLNPLHVWALALGSIIGWGAFVMPGTTFLPQGGPAGTLIGMALAAVVMSVIALSYGYMIQKYPVAGGEYAYASATFGKAHAFFCVWFLVLAYAAIVPLNATALGLVSQKLFNGLFEFGYLYNVAGYDVYAGEVILASVVLIAFAYLSIKGVGLTGGMQAVLAVCLVGTVAIIGIIAVISPNASVENLSPAFPSDVGPIAACLSVVAVAPWAFVGFDSVPQAAEEFKFSTRKATQIMVVAIVFGAVVYVVMSFVTASVAPWEGFIASSRDWPTGDAVEALAGKVGLVFLGVAVLCATLTGINGFYMATSRLLYSVAKDGSLPQWFARIDENSHTPKNAIIFVMVISLIAPWFGREVLGWIVDMSSLGAAIGFTYACATCFVTIKRSGDKKPVLRVLAALGTCLGVLFVLLLVVPGSPSFLSLPSWICLFVWCLLGAVFAWVRRDSILGK